MVSYFVTLTICVIENMIDYAKGQGGLHTKVINLLLICQILEQNQNLVLDITEFNLQNSFQFLSEFISLEKIEHLQVKTFIKIMA
jgi:hypothetical protein